MAGSALSQLLDWYSITGPQILTSADALVNEAQRPNYMLKWLLSGDSMGRLQGGKYIQDWILTDAGNTASFYLPGATRTYSNPNSTATHQIDWRFVEDHMTFLETDTDLQGVGSMTRSARMQVYKNIVTVKEKRMATSLSGKMEDALVAQPDASLMEGSTATAVQPYSIFTFLNEYGATAGTYEQLDGTTVNPYGTTTRMPNGFTTVANLSQTTNPAFRCWQFDYSDPAPTSTAGNYASHNLFAALSRATKYTSAEALPYKAEQSTVNDPFKSNYVFLCSMRGHALVESINRASQNYFRPGPQDPHYGDPIFGGIPFKWLASMNNALVYPTSGTTAPAVGSGAGEFDNMNGSLDPQYYGPRFALASKEWLKPVFHSDHYFAMRPDIIPSAQPDTKVKMVNCWYNIFPRSLKKMAFIYPSADITGS